MAQVMIKTPGEVLGRNSLTNIPASGNTELLELDTRDIDRLSIELVMSANQALDAFVMQAKIHPDSSYVTITSAITATPGGVVIAASGALASLAAGATGWALLDVRTFFSVKFLASGATNDTADVTIRARGVRGAQ